MWRDFIPPVIVRAARSLRGRPRPKRYDSYEAALAECSDRGYENRDIIEVVYRKTMRYRDNIESGAHPVRPSSADAYSLFSLLSSISNGKIKVLDFGGACGSHYFAARAFLPASCKLKWVVVETPAMAAMASALATQELSFSSDPGAAAASLQNVDLLLTSGALQFVSCPEKVLKQLVSIGATRILFSRLGLTEGTGDVITVHESWLSANGPGPMPEGIQDRKVRYPITFMRKSRFDQILRERYEPVVTFDDPSGVIAVGNEPIIGLGLLARTRAPARHSTQLIQDQMKFLG